MSHYETLGVPPTASADDIKTAYRRLARQAHPDQGGTHDDMAKINIAYQVLNDPERRRRYDDTGQDQLQPSLEQTARNTVLELLGQALQRDGNCIAHARTALQQKLADTRVSASKLHKQIARLEKRRRLITVKSGDNLVHMLIDQQVTSARQTLDQIEAWTKVGVRAMEILEAHESAEEMPNARTHGKGYLEAMFELDDPFDARDRRAAETDNFAEFILRHGLKGARNGGSNEG